MKKSNYFKIVKIFGALLYLFARKVNLRFLLPKSIANNFDKLKGFSLRMQGAQIGAGSIIRNDVFIAFPDMLTVSENTTVGAYARIFNYSSVSIGKDTEIGPGLHVQTNDHSILNSNSPLGKQGGFSKRITIGNGVYIGSNVTILSGVNVSDLCVVAAGAVLTKDTESGYIYGGVPARKIKKI